MVYEQFLSGFTSWRPAYSCWPRFSIAEKFGKKEINTVYNDIFKAAKSDYKLLTELVMVLNHKVFEYSEYPKNTTLCAYYSELFLRTKNYALDTLNGAELQYFLETID